MRYLKIFSVLFAASVVAVPIPALAQGTVTPKITSKSECEEAVNTDPFQRRKTPFCEKETTITFEPDFGASAVVEPEPVSAAPSPVVQSEPTQTVEPPPPVQEEKATEVSPLGFLGNLHWSAGTGRRDAEYDRAGRLVSNHRYGVYEAEAFLKVHPWSAPVTIIVGGGLEYGPDAIGGGPLYEYRQGLYELDLVPGLGLQTKLQDGTLTILALAGVQLGQEGFAGISMLASVDKLISKLSLRGTLEGVFYDPTVNYMTVTPELLYHFGDKVAVGGNMLGVYAKHVDLTRVEFDHSPHGVVELYPTEALTLRASVGGSRTAGGVFSLGIGLDFN